MNTEERQAILNAIDNTVECRDNELRRLGTRAEVRVYNNDVAALTAMLNEHMTTKEEKTMQEAMPLVGHETQLEIHNKEKEMSIILSMNETEFEYEGSDYAGFVVELEGGDGIEELRFGVPNSSPCCEHWCCTTSDDNLMTTLVRTKMSWSSYIWRPLMPDITMCANEYCLIQDRCKRHPSSGAVPNDLNQSWAAFESDCYQCKDYLEVRENEQRKEGSV